MSSSRHATGAQRVSLRVPVMITVFGLVLTTLFAIEQQHAAEREQALIFSQEVASEQAELDDVIQEALDSFRDGIQFIEATYPGDTESYTQFFAAERYGEEANIDADPGVTVIEAVEPEDESDFVARERASGDSDFAVVRFAPEDGATRYVVTRTQNEVVTPFFSLRGLDLGPIAENSGIVFPEQGLALQRIESSNDLAVLLGGSSEDTSFDSLFLIIEPIPLAENEGTAWAARFFSPELVLARSRVESPMLINTAVRLGGELFEDDVRNSSLLYDDAVLMHTMQTNTDGLSWDFLAWADGDLGVETGLFDQTDAWAIGLIVTALIGGVALWRALHERNLARTNVELEHARVLASTDGLTGLLNREGFLAAFEDFGENPSGTLFFVDLDGFKAINDSIGHTAGDGALREAARQIRRNFRGDDIVSRFGGDEFVAYAPFLLESDVAASIAQRIVESVHASAVDGGSQLSCSVGIATRRNSHPGLDQLIDDADAAMYRAKQRGGGQVAATEV